MQQCVMISYFYDKLFIAAFFVFLFIVFLVYKYKVAEPSARILLRTKVKKSYFTKRINAVEFSSCLFGSSKS